MGWVYHFPPAIALYLFSQQINLLNFMRHAAKSLFFPPQNAMHSVILF